MALPVLDRGRGRHLLSGVNEGAAYLKLFLLAIILLQRFAVPFGGGQVPLLLPVGLAIVAVAVWRGVFVIDPLRASLVAVMWLTALVCTLAQVMVGLLPSVLSLGLLLLLYIPALFVARVGQAVITSVFRFYVYVMTVAAVVSVAQFGLQYVGVPNTDYIADTVPPGFVLQGF
uniref:hypothetical protein n=1 Tax=Naasia sp. SYSU D00057 TaxID=2817380 RepID=UPI001B3058D8